MTKRNNNMVGAYLKGVSVVRAYLDDNNYLIIELSDGVQQTAGQIPACDTVLNNESLKPLTNKAVTDHFTLERALTASFLAKKVDKVDGKGLSTEDFTTTFKVKLEGLENYDDTAVRSMIKATEARLNALVGQSASDAIDTFNEIVNFLASIEDTTTLEGIVAGIEQHITANQMNIATLTSRVDAEEKKNIVLIYSLAQAGLEGEAVATLQNNNYIDLLTLLYNQGTVKPAVDVYIESRSGNRHWLTDTVVGTVGNMVQLSGLILTKGWVYYVKISHALNTQTANYQCTSENLSRTQTLYYNYENITLAEGKTLALRGDTSLSTLKQYYSPFSVIVNIFTINGVTHSFIARCSYSSADGIFIITGSYLEYSTNISRRIFISQPVDSHTATITDIYEQNIARAEDITALTDRIATASMTLRGTYTATDVDSPVVWTTPYDELLRIAESMKRAEAGEDNNTLYYIVLDGPLGQLQAQLSYIKPWEMWMGEIPFTLAPANEHALFIIHLSITLPEDDNQRLQANCWVGRKRLPTMDQIATRFVDTKEQMLGPQGRLQARTNIGLPIHRLWMQLDRSEGAEGVFCICKRAEGYDEENAATIAAMVAANDSDTPSHDMFLITIFEGNTAVTGELNMINGEMWGSEIILGTDFGNKHTWLFSVDAELVVQGAIDQSRVQFCYLPNDITRSAVITGSQQLSLTSDQIAVARGNMQIYTVVCDGMGNSLTTASQTALKKMYEIQQGADVANDSLFIIKVVDGSKIYTSEVTYSGKNYWVGLTSSEQVLNADGALLYPIFALRATVWRAVQGNSYRYTIKLTVSRSHLLSDSALPNIILPTVDSALHPLRANTAQSFEATQLAQLRANMHITDTWLLSAKPRITIFYPLDAAKGNVPRMTITHPLAEAGGVEGEFVLMRWQRRRPWEKADQRGRFKPSRWCAAKPVMIQNAGWDPDQDPLPESMRKPYIFAADVRGNDFYKMLVDILLYTAFYTSPTSEGEKVRGEGPLWEGEVAEGWEVYLPSTKGRITYCWAQGANACDIGIAYRVLNPAYEGHTGGTPDGIPAPDPNEEWQAWDSEGNPRWLYSNVAPMRISRGGAITKSYRNEQEVRYPLLRVVEK